MKCENCGAESTDKFCPYCESEMPYSGPNTVIINNYYNGDSNKSEDDTFHMSSTKKEFITLQRENRLHYCYVYS